MKKWITAAAGGLLASMLFAGMASAHVTVQPKETIQGSYEVFTVRVPSEKDVPTMKVEVKIPPEVDVTRFEPKPGWTYAVTRDDTKKIIDVIWTATGDGLSSTEFGDFHMQGKVADTAKELKWKAYQTYKDGSVVEWTGAPDAQTPASVTTVNPKPAGAATDSHGNTAATADDTASGSGTTGKTPLYLSIAALVLGVLALLVSLFKRAK